MALPSCIIIGCCCYFIFYPINNNSCTLMELPTCVFWLCSLPHCQTKTNQNQNLPCTGVDDVFIEGPFFSLVSSLFFYVWISQREVTCANSCSFYMGSDLDFYCYLVILLCLTLPSKFMLFLKSPWEWASFSYPYFSSCLYLLLIFELVWSNFYESIFFLNSYILFSPLLVLSFMDFVTLSLSSLQCQ